MLANLRALFGVVIDIVLLRRGPEHLPASAVLFAITMALYAVVAGFVASVVTTGAQTWVLELVVVMVVTPLWYRVALQLANKRERFLQTLTAMFATYLLLAPVAVPAANAFMAQARAYEVTKVQPSAALSLLVLFLTLWRFVIFVRIVRAAFEWQTFPAVMLVLGHEFAMVLVLFSLAGVPAQPT
jgi:hypothetical protein